VVERASWWAKKTRKLPDVHRGSEMEDRGEKRLLVKDRGEKN